MIRRMLPAAPGSVTGTNIWINHNKNKTLPRILLPKVLEDGPLAPKTTVTGARGTGRCTLGAEIGQKRFQGCRRMYPWRRKRPETLPMVPVDVPLEPKSSVTGAKGASGCTPGAGKHRNWSQGCRRMHPWRRKAPKATVAGAKGAGKCTEG